MISSSHQILRQNKFMTFCPREFTNCRHHYQHVGSGTLLLNYRRRDDDKVPWKCTFLWKGSQKDAIRLHYIFTTLLQNTYITNYTVVAEVLLATLFFMPAHIFLQPELNWSPKLLSPSLNAQGWKKMREMNRLAKKCAYLVIIAVQRKWEH